MKKLAQQRCAEEREIQSEHQATYDAAYRALLKDKKAVSISLIDKCFILYCGDYIEHFFHEDSHTKRLDFDTTDSEGKSLQCQVYLTSGTRSGFRLSDRPPSQARVRSRLLLQIDIDWK